MMKKTKIIELIKLKEELDRLQKIEEEEYSKWCIKQDTYSNEFHKEMNKLRKPIEKIYKQFKKIGIKFNCKDYGGNYCLCPNGLILVLNLILGFDKSKKPISTLQTYN